MLVSKGWDVDLIDMWKMTNNEKAVLTSYVPRLEDLGVNINNRNEVRFCSNSTTNSKKVNNAHDSCLGSRCMSAHIQRGDPTKHARYRSC